jgi:AraC-like DNA-binding protein
VVTAPDVAHEIDPRGGEVLLVFIEPESDVGEALRPTIGKAMREIGEKERLALDRGESPMELMKEGGVGWTRRVVEVLGGAPMAGRPHVHPRVRRLLALLREEPDDTSLAALAERVGLSPGRLMHTFTESIGVPLRPYLAWLRLQRAAAAIAGGSPLSDAAVTAGFSDAAHMTRTFRRMLGMAPSMLQPVRSRPGKAEDPG